MDRLEGNDLVLTESSHQQQVDQLQEQVRALKAQLRQAQRLATIGTMAAMVAHEFNNILTPVINYAQAAQKNPRLVEKAIVRAADGGERATAICNAILNVARNQMTTVGPANVRQLVQETLAVIARDFSKDCIELKLDIPEELDLETCKVELQQVLLNLISNARTALLDKPGRRNITISARPAGERVELSVADTGCGIPEEHIEKIFLPFFTTCTCEGCGSGSGLGLSVCREITEALGGTISVTSQAGRGACFTLSLPTTPPATT